jgi:hypothetical protein
LNDASLAMHDNLKSPLFWLLIACGAMLLVALRPVGDSTGWSRERDMLTRFDEVKPGMSEVEAGELMGRPPDYVTGYQPNHEWCGLDFVTVMQWQTDNGWLTFEFKHHRIRSKARLPSRFSL